MAKIKKKSSLSDKPEQVANKKKVGGKLPPLATELIQLKDDFAEFCDISAFLCHALASSLSDREWLNQEIISGARICSNWLQSRTTELKTDIRHVHARYVAESKKKSTP